MANEKRLIDANALKKAIWNVDCNVYEFCEGCVTEMGLSRLLLDDVIDEVPTVDAVEVVRCKDCKKWLKVEPSGTNCRYCAISTRSRLPYDFCSYGERR